MSIVCVIYVCMYVCMCYVCMYVCILSMQVCILCMYIMYVCIIFYMYIHVLFFSSFLMCNLIESITENNIYLFR